MPAEMLTQDKHRASQTLLRTAVPKKHGIRAAARGFWRDRTLRR